MAADVTPDNRPVLADKRRSAALTKVEDYIVGVVGGYCLPTHILDQYRKQGFGAGWRVPTSFPDDLCRQLDVLVDDDFPYTPPRIAVANGPDALAWPHLEANGLLCILSADAAVSDVEVVEVTRYVLGEACRLIENSITGGNAEDFRQEFLSYWKIAADKNKDNRKFISLLDPRGPGRRVSVWRGEYKSIVGESQETLRRWLPRWGAKMGVGQDYALHDGVLIWLTGPLLPAEYPGSAADVRALMQEQSPESVATLEELAASAADNIDVVMGASTPNGACFASMTLRRPRRTGPAAHRSDPLVRGFRPGHVPRTVLLDRYLSKSVKATKISVERADHRWIHGRDRDARQERLRCAQVAILGCGSLGASLSCLLAQAGVGNLLLIDPDIMEWPNIGRHALGAASVGLEKAFELAQEIERSYPHLGNITWRRERVGPKARKLVAELSSFDLVISVMGNWAGESFLNDFQQEAGVFPPILYGWLEPNAAAAHAVFVSKGGACLRCGMNDTGRPHIRVTDWTKVLDDFQEPACGAQFTPYGPSELCWAHALLAEMAIDALTDKIGTASHRIWVGSRDHLEAAGGRWTTEWVEQMGDPGAGRVTVLRPWLISKTCPVCIRRARGS